MTQITQIEAAHSPLVERNGSVPAESDFDALSERFHRLVDKEFLGTLTSEEEEELKKLTVWHSGLRTEFHQSLSAGDK